MTCGNPSALFFHVVTKLKFLLTRSKDKMWNFLSLYRNVVSLALWTSQTQAIKIRNLLSWASPPLSYHCHFLNLFRTPPAQASPYSANGTPFPPTLSANVSNYYDPQNHLESDHCTKLYHKHIRKVTKLMIFFPQKPRIHIHKLFSVVNRLFKILFALLSHWGVIFIRLLSGTEEHSSFVGGFFFYGLFCFVFYFFY